nr:hypothetical protein [Tanacetum cinerariifolium]
MAINRFVVLALIFVAMVAYVSAADSAAGAAGDAASNAASDAAGAIAGAPAGAPDSSGAAAAGAPDAGGAGGATSGAAPAEGGAPSYKAIGDMENRLLDGYDDDSALLTQLAHLLFTSQKKYKNKEPRLGILV